MSGSLGAWETNLRNQNWSRLAVSTSRCILRMTVAVVVSRLREEKRPKSKPTRSQLVLCSCRHLVERDSRCLQGRCKRRPEGRSRVHVVCVGRVHPLARRGRARCGKAYAEITLSTPVFETAGHRTYGFYGMFIDHDVFSSSSFTLFRFHAAINICGFCFHFLDSLLVLPHRWVSFFFFCLDTVRR